MERIMIGKVIKKFEDDVSTDCIYPGRFMATVLPIETPQFAFADDKKFNETLVGRNFPENGIILAGKNFGCGSSREQAVSAIQGYKLTIIAKGVARIFMQNAINLGLNVVVCPTIEAEENDKLEISRDKIRNFRTGDEYPVSPLSKSQQEVMGAGGLIAFTRSILRAQQKEKTHE